MNVIKILKYLRPYKWLVALIFFLVALRAGLELLLPLLMGKLLTHGLGIDSNTAEIMLNSQAILKWTGLMLGVAVISIFVTIFSGYLESKVASSFGRDLRKEIYKKVASFSMGELDHFTTSSLITRTTNDIQQLQNYVNMLLRMIILQPVMAIGAVILAVNLSPSLSVILIVSVVSLLFMIIVIFAITLPRIKVMQKIMDRLNLVIRENLTGLRVIRAYNTQEFQENRIAEASLENKKQNTFVSRVSSLMWPGMSFIMGVTSLVIIILSQNKISASYTPEDMMTLMQYGMRIIMSFMFITMMFMMIPRASISAQRIMEVLEYDSRIKEPSHPVEVDLEKIHPTVEFRDVEFKYPNAQQAVLQHINFKAPAGKVTALIGSTGSGKSTLINLIPRFYDCTNGQILIDDLDIKTIKLKELYNLIGYVPQKGILFGGTIADNIAFGQEIEQEEVIKAAQISQASTFIESFDRGYDYHVAQGGNNVSGGQRQRISIARALAKNPKILIFDDSFSALDYQTDQALRKKLNEVEATKIIVAQRINTIKNADQIIVLDQGAIVGIGKHNELMQTCEVYQEIAYSQLSKEELEEDINHE